MSQSRMRSTAAILCVFALSACSGEADFSGSLKIETLPAEQYQQQIIAIDRLLFQPNSLGDDGVRALQGDLEDLARKVAGAKADSRFLKLESLELRHLASRAKRLAPEGTGAELQNDWMRIRNNLFDDRAWFARSANDLDYAASVTQTTSQAIETETHPAQIARAPRDSEPVAPPPRDSEWRARLTGRWQVVSMLANGHPTIDDELTGSIWTFDAPRLVVRDRKGSVTTYNFTASSSELAVTTETGKDGWMKYEIDGGGLRIAFFDGLNGKPATFDAESGQKPLLVVLRLTPVE